MTGSFSILFLSQHHADEAGYINPVYIPLFLLYNSFLPTVTGEWIDCAVSLILWLCCHFEVGDQNQDGTQQWQWSASTHQKLEKPHHWRGPMPHTLSHPADPILLRSSGKHSDGTRLKSLLDRWSHQQPSSLLQPLLLPSIMFPVCPVLIGTFQFINHLKKISEQPHSLRLHQQHSEWPELSH